MNSRIVRPLLIRAVNTPTNGDQLIHQDQKAPVVERIAHCDELRFPGLRLDVLHGGWRAGEMFEWFGDAEKDDADAHSGAHHHREPGEVAKLRFCVPATEAHGAEPAGHQPQHEDEQSCRCKDIEPPECADKKSLRRLENMTGRAGKEGAEQDETDHDERGTEKNGWLHASRQALPEPTDPGLEGRTLYHALTGKGAEARVGAAVARAASVTATPACAAAALTGASTLSTAVATATTAGTAASAATGAGP